MKATFFEIEGIFAPIADVVDRFANAHNLKLKKCARGNSGWELVRSHPDGGDVFVLLMYDTELGLGIAGTWQFRCPEMGRDYTHFRNVRQTPIESAAVSVAMSEELDAIVAVKFGHWTHVQPLRQQNDD
jgi:hypothetical protein